MFKRLLAGCRAARWLLSHYSWLSLNILKMLLASAVRSLNVGLSEKQRPSTFVQKTCFLYAPSGVPRFDFAYHKETL